MNVSKKLNNDSNSDIITKFSPYRSAFGQNNCFVQIRINFFKKSFNKVSVHIITGQPFPFRYQLPHPNLSKKSSGCPLD